MIAIKCPKCQLVVTVDPVPVDTVVPCYHCGERIVVSAAKPAPLILDAVAVTEEEDADRVAEVEIVEEAISPQDAEVLAELEKLQTQRPSWWGVLGVLAISLLLYMGAAKTESAWQGVIILILVLAFHESGHYVMMRCFGYRNLRMFFIPFFGAAVSGQHYNIAGWKKVVVALAGPLPGILIGVPLAVFGLFLHEPTIIEVAQLMLILNGLNLLPFLPLDGGWVVHSVLFVRHPLLDVVFRLVAALCIIGMSALIGAWLLLALAVFMLFEIPIAWRRASIAYLLKQRGTVSVSADTNSIPTEAALAILAELRRGFPQQTNAKFLAQNVANVFETLNAHPPGVLASLGLLAVHAGSFFVVLVMIVVIAVVQNRPA